jgi:hypothetical protein
MECKTDPLQRYSAVYIPGPLDLEISESFILDNCYRVHYLLDGKLVVRYEMDNGEVTVIEEDMDCNDIIDHRLYIENGIIKYGRRDLDEDGYFEAFEYYHDGHWKGIAVDTDSDNVAEYYEDWSYVRTRLWDFNGDSVIDTVYLLRDEEEVNQYGLLFPEILYREDLLYWNFEYENHLFR